MTDFKFQKMRGKKIKIENKELKKITTITVWDIKCVAVRLFKISNFPKKEKLKMLSTPNFFSVLFIFEQMFFNFNFEININIVGHILLWPKPNDEEEEEEI